MTALAPTLQAFFSTLFNRRHIWAATSAQRRSQQPSALFYIWPHMLLISLSLAGALTGWIGARDPGNTTINSLWALVNAYLLATFIWHGSVIATDEAPASARTPELSSQAIELENTYGI